MSAPTTLRDLASKAVEAAIAGVIGEMIRQCTDGKWPPAQLVEEMLATGRLFATPFLDQFTPEDERRAYRQTLIDAWRDRTGVHPDQDPYRCENCAPEWSCWRGESRCHKLPPGDAL
ncbi:MAG: hypothetical protein EPN91_12000 [Salinibacterium sp.]|nr:MAG: hypothetical protein EPN91_12000 [Salinibacterium sp.]